MKYSAEAVQTALSFAEGMGSGNALKQFAPPLECEMSYVACDILACEVRNLQAQLSILTDVITARTQTNSIVEELARLQGTMRDVDFIRTSKLINDWDSAIKNRVLPSRS